MAAPLLGAQLGVLAASSPFHQSCCMSRKHKIFWDCCGTAAEQGPRAKASPKTTTGVPREGPNPREKSSDRESFHFLSLFAFSRARLDYSFQQHKVLERLSSQRSIFSALGAMCLCRGKWLSSLPSHCAETWWVAPGAVAAALPEGGWQGTCASPHLVLC